MARNSLIDHPVKTFFTGEKTRAIEINSMMASSVITANISQHHMDRLDAARALLGVSPQAPDSSPSSATSRLSTSRVTFGSPTFLGSSAQSPAQQSQAPPLASPSAPRPKQNGVSKNVSFEPSVNRGLFGLDALAALASKEQETLKQNEPVAMQESPSDPALIVSASTTGSSSSDDDSEAMPPPPPRTGGRRRSVSNPEGMEKWAPYNRTSRRDFVLPASILEEELAEASAAMEAHERNLPSKERAGSIGSEEEGSECKPSSPSSANVPVSGLMSAEEQANLTPEELLKRARSRLLEDLSEGSLNGEKGVLTLPHSLSKYKEVGIADLAEGIKILTTRGLVLIPSFWSLTGLQ
jgi:hypothetical protein